MELRKAVADSGIDEDHADADDPPVRHHPALRTPGCKQAVLHRAGQESKALAEAPQITTFPFNLVASHPSSTSSSMIQAIASHSLGGQSTTSPCAPQHLPAAPPAGCRPARDRHPPGLCWCAGSGGSRVPGSALPLQWPWRSSKRRVGSG